MPFKVAAQELKFSCCSLEARLIVIFSYYCNLGSAPYQQPPFCFAKWHHSPYDGHNNHARPLMALLGEEGLRLTYMSGGSKGGMKVAGLKDP